MITQMFEKSGTTCNFFPIHLPNIVSSFEAMQASSLDYGFDFDEEELARELLAPLPAGYADQMNLEIVLEDFETSHLWYQS